MPVEPAYEHNGRTVTRDQWRVLAAAKFGWMLDAFDFMLYAMALGQIRTYFGFDDATAGFLVTMALVMSGVGGLIFGYVADRFGRARAHCPQRRWRGRGATPPVTRERRRCRGRSAPRT